MTATPPPPFDAWQWMLACQETWLAGFDPQGVGELMRRRRLARLVATALRDSPFYARRAAGARTLADFAPVGKAELMANFDDWATDRAITRQGAEAFVAGGHDVADAWLGRYLVWSSSGTSGVPGLFVQDAASLAAYDAVDALRLRGADLANGGLGLWGVARRFAYVAATGGPYAGHVSLARLRRLVPAAWAPQMTLLSVLEPIDLLAEQLQALQPEVLISYPSCAAALAQLQLDGALALQLRELWLGGEQLSHTQRALLQRAFGCTVRNAYGCSEFYSLAFECPQGRMHLNSDWAILECVDAQHRPVAPGEFSDTTLLTNLANLTQPLLRYELNDRVRFDPAPCPCGGALPVIEVQGRADDVLALPRPHGGMAMLLPLVLETVLEEDAGITKFQIVRRAGDVLELRLDEADRAAFSQCRHVLRACLARHGVKAVRITLGRHAPQRQIGSGKLRRVLDARGVQ
jgi:phenylacetate-CoA ligase